MDPRKLKDWLEVIGIFALVASLVFVGLQMKQAQDIAIAEQYQARGIYGAEHVGSIAENEHLLDLMANDITAQYEAGSLADWMKEDYETFGATSVAFNTVMASKGLVTLDSYYFQYQQGFMEEEAWAAFRYRFKLNMRDKYYRDRCESDPLEWRESFRKLCLELVAESDVEATQSQ